MFSKIITQPPNVWSPFIGFCRSLVALSSLLTLLFTSSDALFQYGAGVGKFPTCRGVENFGIFCILDDNLILAKVLCIVILTLVILGFMPQITGIIHFWVAFSINTGISMPDGGDQISSNLALLLIPITLTDPRLCHWFKSRAPVKMYSFRVSLGWVSLLAIKIQLIILYFYSATGKMYQTEWSEGSVMYYIFIGPFGPTGIIKLLGDFVTGIPWVAFIMAWGALLIEILLAASPLVAMKYKPYLLLLGLSLHLGILLTMGITSFQIAMFAAVALLVVPIQSRVYSNNYQFNLNWRDWFQVRERGFV